MMQVGQKYYIIAHAYHHYIGEVVDVNPRMVTLKNCIKVHSCQRNWTLFFKDGAASDTSYDVMPDGTEQPYDLGSFPWNHAIPKERPRR